MSLGATSILQSIFTMKILLTSPVTPISSSAYSHRSAQAEIYAQMIYDNFSVTEDVEVVINYGNKIKDYTDFDLVYVYHGNDWGGTLNLFGGVSGLSDPEGLVALHKMHKTLVTSIGIRMPDYAGLLRKRLKPGEKFNSILDELPEHTDIDYSIAPVSFEGTSNLVIGDSHAICMYRPGWEVLSVPFKTLHGALTAPGGIRQLMTDNFAHSGHFENLEFYFGNIDIRHHLMRQPNPEAAAIDLAERYFREVEGRFPSALTKAIYEPLPIENESRKLPKTGYYKGTPFYGTWEERNHIRGFFADSLEQLCQNSGVKFLRWTDYLKNSKGELDFSHMEKPRSVHLARASYPHWQGLNQGVFDEAKAAPTQTPSTSLENFFS